MSVAQMTGWSVRTERAESSRLAWAFTISLTLHLLVAGAYYEGKKLIYVARTRNGFTPATREKLFERLRALETTQCPFANLPETKSGRWGFGLTAAKMSDCRWLKPVLVGQFEFTEWTPDDHLRHARFVGLRIDKNARNVHRET